jgi:hypothetical protein
MDLPNMKLTSIQNEDNAFSISFREYDITTGAALYFLIN